ncbi:gamma-glutamyl-gamma-aminobutyrate hydrolase family protein [Albimonas sp. CAU 1670]|uniref:gamma-glutamyl-gamma-aminobutyrate hydrolase family protein n=1 Tax=Albimonas sp. CAU 1670 TaxID=3032599 RepID=UPI0023DBBA0C|nr:gamma-glutamyl-gamma-aminobutyrate hydrolase family protein [Albimonas sp. CAU 1670]MDF2234871.1 gamma-glutamyl-gamma-aminobutyrate hydrolase family protein [Albimonas sp. CAU 1670]
MWWLSWLGLRVMGLDPVRLRPPMDDALDLSGFDGFLIGGGDDIGADLYGARPLMDVRIDAERDAMELRVLDHALPLDLPVLGICRGAQMLNIHRGGDIHQEVREAYVDVPEMWTPLPVKTVTTEPGVRLREVIGRETFRVNSLHHQAIDRLGEGLRIAARDEWGVVQAIEDASARFRFGVQWHPEFLLWRRPHRRLFRAFAAAVHGAGPAEQRRAARNEPPPPAEPSSAAADAAAGR